MTGYSKRFGKVMAPCPPGYAYVRAVYMTYM